MKSKKLNELKQAKNLLFSQMIDSSITAEERE
jgi:hypothetical protein